MLTIGLLGGMSWESSAEYYRLANELVRDRLGGFHSAQLVMVSVDFAEIEALQAAGDWHSAGRLLAEFAVQTESAGADLLVLCTNTMHLVADQVAAAVGIPLLHIADVASTALEAAGLTTVGLLGTAFTMEQPFYRERLQARGFEVVIPGGDDRRAVHEIIYSELVRGIISADSRNVFREVIQRLTARGAQGVVLACTEIELLVDSADSPVPLFPTTRLHIEAAVNLALGA